jgi:colanic acid/amylovoran biosynthesis glycosyltransferase
MVSNLRVSLVSPNAITYSETFIHAHRQINANIFYYYGGVVPNQLEGVGYIGKTKWDIFICYLIRLIKLDSFTPSEAAFARSLRKNKIDVIFAEYGLTGAALVKVCKLVKIPLITMFHGYDASVRSLITNYRIRYNELFRYSSKIIVVSKVMKERIVTLGCPPEKILITQCAPDDMFYDISPTFSEPLSFVAIGRFVNKKAPYYSVLAIKKVAERYPNVKLYFAGQGELHETVQNLITYFKLEKNIKLLGIISPEEFRTLLKKVTGFIQHSITAADGDMEGTPVTVLEASAAGIPVIATRHAGIPDVIINGETGLLVDEHDVDGMASQIIKLIENPDIAEAMGRKGKENIRMNFSMEKHLGIIKSSLEAALLSK